MKGCYVRTKNEYYHLGYGHLNMWVNEMDNIHVMSIHQPVFHTHPCFSSAPTHNPALILPTQSSPIGPSLSPLTTGSPPRSGGGCIVNSTVGHHGPIGELRLQTQERRSPASVPEFPPPPTPSCSGCEQISAEHYRASLHSNYSA